MFVLVFFLVGSLFAFATHCKATWYSSANFKSFFHEDKLKVIKDKRFLYYSYSQPGTPLCKYHLYFLLEGCYADETSNTFFPSPKGSWFWKCKPYNPSGLTYSDKQRNWKLHNLLLFLIKQITIDTKNYSIILELEYSLSFSQEKFSFCWYEPFHPSDRWSDDILRK